MNYKHVEEDDICCLRSIEYVEEELKADKMKYEKYVMSGWCENPATPPWTNICWFIFIYLMVLRWQHELFRTVNQRFFRPANHLRL